MLAIDEQGAFVQRTASRMISANLIMENGYTPYSAGYSALAVGPAPQKVSNWMVSELSAAKSIDFNAQDSRPMRSSTWKTRW